MYGILFLCANLFWMSSRECVRSFMYQYTRRGCADCGVSRRVSGNRCVRKRGLVRKQDVIIPLMSEFRNTFNEGQLNFMATEKLVIVDENDCSIDESTKKEAHTFSTTKPRGILHRAFSIFLFNTEGKLLLQQRAGDKITFPNVWSNTW